MNTSKQTNIAPTLLTPIEIYNEKVRSRVKYIQKTIKPIDRQSIKLFKDRAVRNNWSDEEYNIEVEKYNENGLLITKKVIDKYLLNQSEPKQSTINYPIIDTPQFNDTMHNYLIATMRYNEQTIPPLNDKVAAYNCDILPKKQRTETHKLAIKDFNKTFSKEFTADYNKEVEKYNSLLKTPILPKRKYQPVHNHIKDTFRVLLSFYASQQKARNKTADKSGELAKVNKNALPPLKLNYQQLVSHKIKGVLSLNIESRTARNHVKRLREAKIITLYNFRGNGRKIYCSISNRLLVIADAKPNQQPKTDNQLVTDEFVKKVPHKSYTTRPILLKENKIKDFDKSNSSIRSLLSQTFNDCLADGYKNTQPIEKNLGSGPKIPQKSTPKNKYHQQSDRLRKIIAVPKHILAQQLSRNEFLNYTAIRKSVFQEEKLYGNLSNDEYRRLVIYDCMKIKNKQHKNQNILAGCWTTALKDIEESWFIDPATKLPFHKETIFNRIAQYRSMLNMARKFYIDTGISPLIPHLYFDKTRTETKEIGWYGLFKVWKKKQQAKQKDFVRKQQQLDNSKPRKRRLTIQNKIENRITQQMRGKISYDQLYDYVLNNHFDWIDSLPAMINRMQDLNNQRYSA